MKVLHIIFGIVIFGLVVNLISTLATGGSDLKWSIISLAVMGSIWAIFTIVDYCIKHKDQSDDDKKL